MIPGHAQLTPLCLPLGGLLADLSHSYFSSQFISSYVVIEPFTVGNTLCAVYNKMSMESEHIYTHKTVERVWDYR